MRLALVMLLLVSGSASAQSLADLSRLEAAHRVSTPPARLYTNADLPAVHDAPRVPASTFADALRAFNARRLELRDHARQAYVAAPANPYWPFTGPATPIAPLSQPWSVTTIAARGDVATYFNGELISGSPLSLLSEPRRATHPIADRGSLRSQR